MSHTPDTIPGYLLARSVVLDTDPAHACRDHEEGTGRHVARCGTCSATWCATCHPTPAMLCPYCNGAWSRPTVTPEQLSEAMDFHHVIQVHDDGTLSAPADVYAPECYWNEYGDGQHIERGTGWQLLDGYSGQHGYPGPIMHESESIGGRMARDILATPGLYVAVVCDDLSDMDPDDDDAETTPAGWAVAFQMVGN